MKIRIALCLEEGDEPEAVANLGGIELSAADGVAVIDPARVTVTGETKAEARARKQAEAEALATASFTA